MTVVAKPKETIITVHIPPGFKYHESDAAKRNGFTLVRQFDVGRNQLCPCGSGLKFKRCHGVEHVVSSSK